MDKEVVKELIQNDLNEKTLEKQLRNILDETNRSKMFLNYFDLEKKLGGKGASEKVAKLIINKTLK
jgi:lipid-A-disaccharide synthase